MKKSSKEIHKSAIWNFDLVPLCLRFQDQFEQHLRADVKINVYLYYGADRNRSKKFLSSQDVVITTYNVLSADFGVSAIASPPATCVMKHHGAMHSSCSCIII